MQVRYSSTRYQTGYSVNPTSVSPKTTHPHFARGAFYVGSAGIGFPGFACQKDQTTEGAERQRREKPQKKPRYLARSLPGPQSRSCGPHSYNQPAAIEPVPQLLAWLVRSSLTRHHIAQVAPDPSKTSEPEASSQQPDPNPVSSLSNRACTCLLPPLPRRLLLHSPWTFDTGRPAEQPPPQRNSFLKLTPPPLVLLSHPSSPIQLHLPFFHPTKRTGCTSLFNHSIPPSKSTNFTIELYISSTYSLLAAASALRA